MMMCCIVGLRTSLLLLICPGICPIFFLSVLMNDDFFVKGFCGTLQARVVIFLCRLMILCCFMGLGTSLLLLIQYLSDFLSFLTLNDEFCFVKGFCKILQARVVIFGMRADDDVLYSGIANQPSAAYSSQYLSNFLSCHTLNDVFLSKISLELCTFDM